MAKINGVDVSSKKAAALRSLIRAVPALAAPHSVESVGESERSWLDFLLGYAGAWRPSGTHERQLVYELATIGWRVGRLQALEAASFESAVQDAIGTSGTSVGAGSRLDLGTALDGMAQPAAAPAEAEQPKPKPKRDPMRYCHGVNAGRGGPAEAVRASPAAREAFWQAVLESTVPRLVGDLRKQADRVQAQLVASQRARREEDWHRAGVPTRAKHGPGAAAARVPDPPRPGEPEKEAQGPPTTSESDHPPSSSGSHIWHKCKCVVCSLPVVLSRSYPECVGRGPNAGHPKLQVPILSTPRSSEEGIA